jgi:hypothetical protein
MTFKQLFQQAGYHVLTERLQEGFPRHLYDVRMYALEWFVDDFT